MFSFTLLPYLLSNFISLCISNHSAFYWWWNLRFSCYSCFLNWAVFFFYLYTYFSALIVFIEYVCDEELLLYGFCFCFYAILGLGWVGLDWMICLWEYSFHVLSDHVIENEMFYSLTVVVLLQQFRCWLKFLAYIGAC